jgi:hypothetical protein
MSSLRAENTWSELMGHAYTSGVAAGKRDKASGRDLRTMRAKGYQFRAAFLQGYAHGRSERFTPGVVSAMRGNDE